MQTIKRPLTLLAGLALAAGLFAGTCRASDPITISVTATGDYAIPTDYIGLAFPSSYMDGNNGYMYLFNPSHNCEYAHLTNFLSNMGVRHIRTIASGWCPCSPDPNGTQIDYLFSFAKNSGVTGVIYSLHLFNETNDTPNENDFAASYIWNSATDQPLLDAFAMDNEPDGPLNSEDGCPPPCCDASGSCGFIDPIIVGYNTPSTGGYKSKWQHLIENTRSYLNASSAPFSGPDTYSLWTPSTPSGTPGSPNTSVNGVPFTLQHAMDQAPTYLKSATQHAYCGGDPSDDSNGRNLTTLAMAEWSLSTNRLTDWNTDYSGALAGNADWPSGLPFRFNEEAPYLNGGNWPGNAAFFTALWDLEFFHWWARHGCQGVDPMEEVDETNCPIWKVNSSGGCGYDFQVAPRGYGMMAFSLAGPGNYSIDASKVQVTNPDNINVTAYGDLSASGNDLYITIINKTFNSIGSVDAAVTIKNLANFTPTNGKCRYVVMDSGSYGDATAIGSAELGGTNIPTTGQWNGTWNNLPWTNSECSLTVYACSAVVVDLGK